MTLPHPLDYDVPVRRLTVDGVEVVYADEAPSGGEAPLGRPVVLVHGLGATLDHWALAIPRLARKRRVVALDLPGFGRSGKPDRSYGPQTYVEILERFFRELDLGPVFLVGHSMGGAICAEHALVHPERVDRLVLVDAAGMTRMPPRLIEYLVQRFERNVDPAKVHLPPRLVRALVRLVFYEPIPFAERNVARILAARTEADWADRVRSFVRAATGLSRSQVRERLTDISRPTLIVWGERDRLLPIRHGRMLREGIRDSRMVVFPRTGHCPMIERPDRFCDVVEAFLAGEDVGRETEREGAA